MPKSNQMVPLRIRKTDLITDPNTGRYAETPENLKAFSKTEEAKHARKIHRRIEDLQQEREVKEAIREVWD